MAAQIIWLVLSAIYYYLPAYFANGMPIAFGGGFPVDFGKNWKDGKRILGDGKTFQGMLFGIGVGTLAIGLIQGTFLLAFLLSAGAILGDLAKSFFKRRRKIGSGEKFFPWDQIDFLIGATLLSSIAKIPRIEFIIIIFIITPAIHLLANYGAYKLKIKSVPW